MMPRAEFWLIFVHALAALAALFLAALAIWGEWFRAKLAAPKLRVSLRSEKGTFVRFLDGTKSRFYHLLVENQRRWFSAGPVIVIVRDVERLAHDANWESVMHTGPVWLKWQFGGGDRKESLIGSERFCDFGFVRQGHDFQLALQVTPKSLDPCVRKNERIRVTVAAVAGTTESPAARIEVSWDGEWEDGADEMQRHLIVKEVTQNS